jgi:uncharacterized membrane protein YesL
VLRSFFKCKFFALNFYLFSCIFYFEFKCRGKLKINFVIIFVHLGLDQFLKQLREFAELVLFTAGLKGLIITSPYI